MVLNIYQNQFMQLETISLLKFLAGTKNRMNNVSGFFVLGVYQSLIYNTNLTVTVMI